MKAPLVKLALACAMAGLTQPLCAGTMGPVDLSWQPVFTLSLGPAWNMQGETQTILLQPDVEKAYIATDANHTFLNAELFLGVELPAYKAIRGQLGVALAGASYAKMTGDIWEDADPEFNNYTYAYRVNHGHVALQGALLADCNGYVLPYINGSIGVGFNRAQAFSIVPNIEEEVAAPPFQDNSQTAFTYTVGAGVQKEINAHWRAGVGYEFADWGKNHLNPADGQTLNTGLSMSHLYVNSLLFNISYLG